MAMKDCGGCRGEGAHSPRCFTQPGALWRRLANQAEDLGDMVGSNDMEAANTAYSLAGRFTARYTAAFTADATGEIATLLHQRANDLIERGEKLCREGESLHDAATELEKK